MKNWKSAALATGIALALLVVSAPAWGAGTMFVKNDMVGIGIDPPTEKLHVFQSTGKTFILAQNTNGGTDGVAVLRAKADTSTLNFQAHGSGRTISRFGKTLGGWAEFLSVNSNGMIVGTNSGPLVLGTNSTNNLEINTNGSWTTSTGATLSAGGAWTNASSRALKQDVEDLSAEESLAAFTQLTPVKYHYKADPTDGQLGFIAEDVPDLVATSDRKGLSPMDIVALMTKVVQQQQSVINELSERVAQLEGSSAAH